MSELKADKTFVFGEECEAYKKSEADEVIANKDAVITELNAQVNGLRNRANLWLYNAQNEHNAAVAVRMENAKLKQKIAEQETENHKLKEIEDKCRMHDFFWEGCGFAKRGFKNSIAVSEAYDFLEAENKQLKERIEVLNHQVCKMNCAMVKHYNEVCDNNIRQKYKRCVTMADLCTARAAISYSADWDDRKFNHYSKWHDRWLILADKIYKETK